jgi:hypothetical protein
MCRHVFLFDMSKKPARDKEFQAKLDELMLLQQQVRKNCTEVFPNAVMARKKELEEELLDTTYEKKVQYQEAEKAEKRLKKTDEFLRKFAEFEQTYMADFQNAMDALGKHSDQVPATPES